MDEKIKNRLEKAGITEEQLKEITAVIDGLTAEHGEKMKKKDEEHKKALEESTGKKAEELNSAFSEKENGYKSKIAELERSIAINDALAGVKFSSTLAREAVVAKLKGGEYEVKDGKISGVDELMEQLKKDDSGAFIIDDGAPASASAGGGSSSGASQTDGVTKAFYDLNPELV